DAPRRTTTGRSRKVRPAAPATRFDGNGARVRALVLAELAPRLSEISADALPGEVRATVDKIIARGDVQISPHERRRFVQEVLQDTVGLGPLDPLLLDATLTEIMVNGFHEVWLEREGRIARTPATFRDEAHYRSVIERIVSGVGRRVDESPPMV